MRRSSTYGWGWALIILGAALLLDNLGWLDFSFFFPIALILLGIYLLQRREPVPLSPEPPAQGVGQGNTAAQPVAVESSAEPYLYHAATFAKTALKSHASAFKGGNVQAVCGKAVLDLREARLAEQRAVLNVSVVCGSVRLMIPAGWRVEVTAPVILGQVQPVGAPPPTDPDAPVLRLPGFVLLGTIEVARTSREARTEEDLDATP
ncbi:LiaF domain-containing protein [Marinithermus hydrothermalis]|uniref:Transmembrane protein n=1 Tax=Marinithermus hydrothermalis (strain DSM 14884 / JCM 11576 / T1) TaxID=869210 RepID=F2NKN7_MARHT|nr:LiaF domain-containing protein [Marinithermus hydrothermalis]AEB10800.1 putative transmembrane protein [Marinithermus hydrothermalis DSM 14884]